MDSDKQLSSMFGDFIKTKLSELVNRYFHEELVVQPATVNKKMIVQMTGVSISTLDQHFFNRAEVLAVERDKGNKRLWRYPEIRNLWLEYLDEMYFSQYGTVPPKIEKNKANWTIYYRDTVIKDRRIVALKEGERVVSDKEAS